MISVQKFNFRFVNHLLDIFNLLNILDNFGTNNVLFQTLKFVKIEVSFF